VVAFCLQPPTRSPIASSAVRRALRAILPAQSRPTNPIGKLLEGLFWELSPGPLTPEARIMPLDQTANCEVLINGAQAHVRFSNETLRDSLAMRA
jgi:hypothetical protein